MQEAHVRGWALAVGLGILTSVTAGATGSADADEASVEVEEEYQYSADWTTPHTKSWVTHLYRFRNEPEVHGLEIGCFEGRSSIWLLERIANHPTARMTCIDIFTEPIEKRFDHNLRISGQADRLTKLKGYSQDVLRTLENESFDFAYIDGCHLASCVLTDAVMIWELIKPGGIIIFDDYLWDLDKPVTDRPKLGIDAFLTVFQDRIEVKDKTTQVVIQKKSGRSGESLVGQPVVHTPKWERDFERKQQEAGP